MKTIILAFCFSLSQHLFATLPTIHESKEEHGTPIESRKAEKISAPKPQGDDATLESYLSHILTKPSTLPQENPAVKKLKENKTFFSTKVRLLHTQLMGLSVKLFTKAWLFASEHSNIILKKKEHHKLIKTHMFYRDRYLGKIDH